MWTELLSSPSERALPWTGGREVHGVDRSWSIAGPLPAELGWHRFAVGGSRRARWLGPGEPDPAFEPARGLVRGYLVGDRLVADGVAVHPDVHRVFDQSERVWLAEPGAERFCRARAVRGRDGRLIWLGEEFPLGPEPLVAEAFQDRLESVDHVPGVTPALDLAFRWVTWRRLLADEQRAELAELARLEQEEEARRVAEAERQAEVQAQLAAWARQRERHQDRLEDRARAALAVSGAELLDLRPLRGEEVAVLLRFRRQRLECVVHARTLRVIDSGICLQDHRTGVRGDDRFTLESLPAVIGQAMDEGRLVVYRPGW